MVFEQSAKGVGLRQVLAALGDQLAELLTAPGGLDGIARDVVILDPDDAPDVRRGDVVLLIGLRGRAAVPIVRAAARRGAVAVAVKSRDDVLTQAATDAGVALLSVRADARWEQVESLARNSILAGMESAGETSGDLVSLAQTIASLTGGLVSIEDTSNRVLAYSRSADEVDELRRLSILGRQGPEPWLRLLREWGVYEKVRTSEEVVDVEERPELGIRRRIVVGIHAGSQYLGTIWVMEGASPLTSGAKNALIGAARVTALHLVRSRHNPAAELRLRESLLAGLLAGNTTAAAVAATIGADPKRPAGVLAFTLDETADDRSVLELRRAEMANLIAVHTAAYRRAALVTTLGGRVYALLPELQTTGAILTLTKEIVAAAGNIRAAVGVATDLAQSAAARREADRVLDAGLDLPVASIADVRAEVMVSELLGLLADHPEIRDPRVDALVAYDGKHAGHLVPSLLGYLDSLGDVRAAADRLHIHPNTLRYRIKRAAEVAGIDLDDPKQRLVTQLQLLLRTAG